MTDKYDCQDTGVDIMGECPHCKTPWAVEVDDSLREKYMLPDDMTVSVAIAVIDDVSDTIVAWQCPICNTLFDYFTGEEVEIFEGSRN